MSGWTTGPGGVRVWDGSDFPEPDDAALAEYGLHGVKDHKCERCGTSFKAVSDGKRFCDTCGTARRRPRARGKTPRRRKTPTP